MTYGIPPPKGRTSTDMASSVERRPGDSAQSAFLAVPCEFTAMESFTGSEEEDGALPSPGRPRTRARDPHSRVWVWPDLCGETCRRGG